MKEMARDKVREKHFFKECTKKCPWCEAIMSKASGCNKMTCYSCQGYFCWLCMAKIENRSDPYGHFNNCTAGPGSLFSESKDTTFNVDDKKH